MIPRGGRGVNAKRQVTRAVVMPYLEGRSSHEIAGAIGLTWKTVDSRLHFAREHLKTLALV